MNLQGKCYYNSKYVGQFYKMLDGEVYELRPDGKFAYAGVDSSSIMLVQLTGYYRIGADGKEMFQTTTNGWIRLSDGWENTGYSPIRQYSAKDVEYYINKMIRNNAKILENNLVCSLFANKLNDDEKLDLYLLQTRLKNRNQHLLDDGLCTDIKVASPPGYSLLENKLDSFMQSYSSGIGVVLSTTAVLVVSAVVVASLATAAYFAYKALFNESAEDVKYSDELTKKLISKLTPEEYNQLLNETQGIVTKTKLSSKFGGAFGLVKLVAIAAGVFGIYKLLNKENYG